MPGHIIVLDQYPLQQLNNITVLPVDPATAVALAHPVTEQRPVTAKYRVTEKDGDSQISFAPVQRVHQLDTGE